MKRFLLTAGFAGVFTGAALAASVNPVLVPVPFPAHSCPEQAGPPITVGILNHIHAVDNLDATLVFYRDVFGLTGEPRAFPNPGVPLLTNAPGVSLRLAVLKLPNASHGFELTQFTGVERVPARPRPTDPGAATLLIYVKDLNQVVAAAKKTGATIVTASAEPVQGKWPKGKVSSQPFRSLLLRDPDGYLVRATEEPFPDKFTAPGNVLHVSADYTADNLEATTRFYKDFLGFQFCSTGWLDNSPKFGDLLGGLPKAAKYRSMWGVIPGTTAPVSFTEYKGMPRTKFHLRVRDPGAPAMCLQVKDLDGVLKRMRAAGVEVLSKDGQVVQFSATVRNIFVVDPNGVNLELYENLPAAPK